jgi:hypothetical protein
VIRICARRDPELFVFIDLGPGDWMPLANARSELHRAASEYNSLCEQGPDLRDGPFLDWRFRDWRPLMFALWRFDTIEIGGRLSLPNLSVALKPLDYPCSERWPVYWQVKFDGEDRFLHLASGQRYFDVHLRDLGSEASPQSPPPSPPQSPPPSPALTKYQRCVELLRSVWVEAGCPRWTADQAFREAARQNPGNSALDYGERARRKIWAEAQGLPK